jgi:hypothetical protein
MALTMQMFSAFTTFDVNRRAICLNRVNKRVVNDNRRACAEENAIIHLGEAGEL